MSRLGWATIVALAVLAAEFSINAGWVSVTQDGAKGWGFLTIVAVGLWVLAFFAHTDEHDILKIMKSRPKEKASE